MWIPVCFYSQFSQTNHMIFSTSKGCEIQFKIVTSINVSLQWRHNDCDGVSNHQPRDCLLHRLFRRRSKKSSTLRVTGLCEGNSPVTGEFPAQRASNAENVSIWWRHHVWNSLRPCDAHRVPNVSVRACGLFGAQPRPKPNTDLSPVIS